jgi:CRISPR-associated protein Cas6/Cse3/CasE subtype I-E
MNSNKVSFWLSLIQVRFPERKRLFRYQLHQLIWCAFPGFPAGSKQPFLFALTGMEDQNGVHCLIQSKTKPDWDTALLTKERTPLTITKIHGVKPVQFKMFSGDQFFFQLQACPIKNIFQGRNKRGKKAIIYSPQEAQLWFKRRAEQNGFAVLRNEFFINKMRVRRNPDPHATDITLSTCHFHGQLEVKNVEKFTNALLAGIGKKKIFGFGMLMLSPVAGSN